MNNISLIILASGFSRRFVTNKLLYEFHGKKLIEYAFDKTVFFSDVIVVTQYEEIKEMSEVLGYRVVMNDHPEYGQGHSIALGVGACQNNACILMVADMPYLKLDTLREMVSIQDGKHIVIVSIMVFYVILCCCQKGIMIGQNNCVMIKGQNKSLVMIRI